MTGLELLERAAAMARDLGELPPHADTIVGQLALIAERVIRTSPYDQAENVLQLSKIMREM